MREQIAYILIGAMAATALPWLGVTLFRHRRTKLRRRGIKRYGH